jgi:hypothetical protein
MQMLYRLFVGCVRIAMRKLQNRAFYRSGGILIAFAISSLVRDFVAKVLSQPRAPVLH